MQIQTIRDPLFQKIRLSDTFEILDYQSKGHKLNLLKKLNRKQSASSHVFDDLEIPFTYNI